jgi:hypothetical protein
LDQPFGGDFGTRHGQLAKFGWADVYAPGTKGSHGEFGVPTPHVGRNLGCVWYVGLRARILVQLAIIQLELNPKQCMSALPPLLEALFMRERCKMHGLHAAALSVLSKVWLLASSELEAVACNHKSHDPDVTTKGTYLVSS